MTMTLQGLIARALCVQLFVIQTSALSENSLPDRISWPLQADFSGLVVENLNEYLSLFSHCLINIQNFQGVELPGLEHPIYITRFDVAFLKCKAGSQDNRRLHRFIFGKVHQHEVDCNCAGNVKCMLNDFVNYTDRSFNSRWYCTAQFDLFYPDKKDAPHFYFHSEHFLRKWRPLFDISQEYINIYEPRGFVAATPQPTYYLLVHRQNFNYRNLWSDHINNIWNGYLSHPTRGQTFWMFHLKTKEKAALGIAGFVLTGSVVSITDQHFVFPFCPTGYGYIVVPISKLRLYEDATILSEFWRYLPLRFEGFQAVPFMAMMHEFLNPSKSELKSFDLSLADIKFALLVFPNTTLVKSSDETCYCCKLTLPYDPNLGNVEVILKNKKTQQEWPKLVMNFNLPHILLATKEDRYGFLSCGVTSTDGLNFSVLFIPFSKTVWFLILITILAWPVVLSMIENEFRFRRVLRDVDVFFIGWAMILEQSHFRATNYHKKPALYCYCVGVLFALLILSNAYKGDNINKIAKSFDIVRIKRISELQQQYTVYDELTCLNLTVIGFPHLCFSAYNFSGYIIGNFPTKSFKANSADIQHTGDILLDKISARNLLQKCDNVAVFGWPDELRILRQRLLETWNVENLNVEHDFKFTRKTGWILFRYGSVKILKRMWTLFESGIYNHVHNSSFEPDTAKRYMPHGIRLRGNISTQFIFLSIGVALAMLILSVEVFYPISISFLQNLLASRVHSHVKHMWKSLIVKLLARLMANRLVKCLVSRPLHFCQYIGNRTFNKLKILTTNKKRKYATKIAPIYFLNQ